MESERVFFYAKCVYTDDFQICSNVICKTFNVEDIEQTQKFKIVYSSRLQDLDSSFSQSIESDLGIELTDEGKVEVKRGPMDMYGICSMKGLNTFKICAKRYMPEDERILMLDVFAKEDCEISIKLISDYFDKKESYKYTTKLVAGDFWNNIKLSISDFKREDGMPLKTFSNIQAIEFISENQCIFNNILWV
ncbi:MAG: hypothetical protein MJ066_03875 [Clostridia bacterium]|nr:hypothetical protein [Clostridia bacterium]